VPPAGLKEDCGDGLLAACVAQPEFASDVAALALPLVRAKIPQTAVPA